MGTTAEHLAENPGHDVGPAKRLVHFLLACGKARGDIVASETFDFWGNDGQPDYRAARRFAEGIRDRFLHDEYGHRIGVSQVNQRVVLRLVPINECAEDAVCPAQAMSW